MAKAIPVVLHKNGVTISGFGFTCQICQQSWIPKDTAQPPKRCGVTGCRSLRWDVAKYPDPTIPPQTLRKKKPKPRGDLPLFQRPRPVVSDKTERASRDAA